MKERMSGAKRKKCGQQRFCGILAQHGVLCPSFMARVGAVAPTAAIGRARCAPAPRAVMQAAVQLRDCMMRMQEKRTVRKTAVIVSEGWMS